MKTLKWVHEHQKTLIFLIIAGAIITGIFREITVTSPLYRQFFIRSDLAVYATLLTYQDDPERFEGDLIFGQESLAWEANARLYLWFFTKLYEITDNEFGLTLGLYSWLTAIFYLSGMYLFLNAITKQRWLALLLTFISVLPSGVFASGIVWGILDDAVYPSTLFSALAPWLGWAAYVGWLNSSSQNELMRHLMPFGVGFLGGVLLATVHLAIGLAALQILIVVGLAGVMVRHLAWTSLLTFVMGSGMGSAVRFLSGQVAGVSDANSITLEGAKSVVEFGQTGSMIFPWESSLAARFGSAPAQAELLIILALLLYGVLTLLSLFYGWGNKHWIALGLGLQMLLVLFFMNVGWLPILIGGYLLHYAQKKQLTKLDYGLVLAVVMGILVGPVQQIVIYGVWASREWTEITPLVYELARFILIAYLPLYGLLGRMIGRVANDQAHVSSRAIMGVGLTGIIALNLNIFVSIATLPAILPFLATFIAVVILITQQKWQASLQKPNHSLQIVFATLSFIMVTLMMLPVINHLVEQGSDDIPSNDDELYAYDLTPPFSDVVDWVKANTPSDSLFYTSDFYSSRFRALSQRPVIISSEEWTYGLYVGQDPTMLQSTILTLTPKPYDPYQIIRAAHDHQVEYFVMHTVQNMPGLVQANDGVTQLSLSLEYSNSYYQVYRLVAQPTYDNPFNLPPDLYEKYLNAEWSLPISLEASIFTPSTGTLANFEDELSQIGTLASLADEQAQQTLFDLMMVLQIADSAGEDDPLATWRNNKTPCEVVSVEVDYLLIDSQWMGFLSNEEFTLITNPNAYTVVQEWVLPALEQTYTLYQARIDGDFACSN